MASDWPSNPDSVLRGMWGNLISAAQNGRGAANMWSALRQGAYDWAEGVLGVTSANPPTPESIQARADQLIGHVTIQDMNRYSKLAGEFLRAKDNLKATPRDSQINGSAIFTAPWATTVGNPAVPTRYRLRVLRSLTLHGLSDTPELQWASYDLTGPITTINDAMTQADTMFAQADYSSNLTINGVLDFHIEAI